MSNDPEYCFPAPPQDSGDPQETEEQPAPRNGGNEENSSWDGAPQLSEGVVTRLQERLRHYREKLVRETADLLATPLGEKLPQSAIELLLSHKHWAVLKAASD